MMRREKCGEEKRLSILMKPHRETLLQQFQGMLMKPGVLVFIDHVTADGSSRMSSGPDRSILSDD